VFPLAGPARVGRNCAFFFFNLRASYGAGMFGKRAKALGVSAARQDAPAGSASLQNASFDGEDDGYDQSAGVGTQVRSMFCTHVSQGRTATRRPFVWEHSAHCARRLPVDASRRCDCSPHTPAQCSVS
jgi:hypothetical protein